MRHSKFFLKTGIWYLGIVLFFSGLNLYAEEIKNIVTEGNSTWYVVQKGDTVWKITRKLKNSAWQLPDISTIPNPNLIYPGQRIPLVAASPGQPTVAAVPPVSPTPVTPPPVSAMPSVSPTMPPVSPVSPVIDPSQPAGISSDNTGNSTDFMYTPIAQVGFIKKEPVPPLGVIFKADDDKTIINGGDKVFIKGSGMLERGGNYTIYRTISPIRDRNGSLIGTQYIITGEVEITEAGSDFLVGRVIRAFREINLNENIMAIRQTNPRIPLKPAKAGLIGRIITSAEHSVLMGQHDIVFIDKGLEDGVEPGQEYRIVDRESFQVLPVEFGRVMILMAETTTATALIVHSERNIRKGMEIMGPSL